MEVDRRHVLAVLTLLLAGATALLLVDVLATVFFAITVAYVLSPVSRWFRARGLRPWWASAATSVVGIAGIVMVSTPLVVLLVWRIGSLVNLIRSIPDESVVLTTFGMRYEIAPADVVPLATRFVQDLALSVANAAPVLGIKLTLFGVVVFALLMAGDRAREGFVGVIPGEYRDLVEALAARTRTVLTAIYVVQAGTALGTFLVGAPVFWLLGYEFPFTLAALSGLLQFLPVIGPSLVIGLLAAVDLAAGNVSRAVAVLVLGGVVVAWMPDPIIRPRLARRTGDFPGSLYFIGFTGGLFSLGVVGIIAGPLVVALLVEAGSLLAAELDAHSADGDGFALKTTVADTVPLGWVPPPFEGGGPPDAGTEPSSGTSASVDGPRPDGEPAGAEPPGGGDPRDPTADREE